VGEDVWLCQCTSLAGGVVIGDRTRIHPHVSVGTRVRVGKDAEIGTNSTVLEDVSDGKTVVGSPAAPVE
jgi:acetyltransferase-like isoleucine patch superfamily enzyme